ncbi:MAG: LysR family transcriptional regulator [Pseudomonadota bacterium]
MKQSELEAFQAVAATASFSRAAEQLKLTQPAVSKRIANLEDSLGTRLFDRVGKQVLMTPAGSALAGEAGKVLAAMRDAERAIADLSGEPSGTLRVATSHHIGLHRLAPILRAYAAAYPAVQLDIRFEDSEDAHRLVANGQVELAVVTLADALSPTLETLREERVWRDELRFVIAADHSLARRKRVTLAQLADAPAILPGSKTYTGRIVSELFASAGLSLEPTLSTNYLETVRMLVEAGLGWSMLPESLIGDLARLPVRVRASRDLGIVDNPERSASIAAQRFAATVRRFGDGKG